MSSVFLVPRGQPGEARPAQRRLRGLIGVLVLGGWATAASGGTPALVPLPQQMQVRPGIFTLCSAPPLAGAPALATTRILTDSASLANGQYLAAMCFKSTGCQFQVQTNGGVGPVRGAIVLTTLNALTNLGAEGYELTVAPDSVVIRAPAQAGVFYGVQSLLQLLPPQILSGTPVSGVPWVAPCVYIVDQPRFVWRGWMLDVARHFFNVQEIKQLLDAMALHKLNRFHWHLVDDQGWRIEILKYPNLTQTGAWRNGIDWTGSPRYLNGRASTAWNASGKYGGYYTQADIRDIVAYAQQRYITIVPEIEMPGHSTAGVASYPQYSCNPSYAYSLDNINYTYDVYSPGTAGTFQFLQDILTEVIGLFPSQFIHCGGDEVSSSIWTTYGPDVAQMQVLGISPSSSTAVQQYQHWFSGQIANFLQSKGRTMLGWSEIQYGGVLPNAAVMDWQDNESVATATAGQYVVRSPYNWCYFDFYENPSSTVWKYEPPAQTWGPANLPLSTVYNFDPIPSGLGTQLYPFILGAQGNQWAEYLPSLQNAELRSFPRLCAMAELTWTPAALKSYADFSNRMLTHAQRLAQMGVNYNHSATPPLLGTWTTQASSTTYNTLQWDASALLTTGGAVDVCFYYTSGANGLDVQWVALRENGVELDRDTHAGFAGSSPTSPVFVLHLPFRKPGATYTIQASTKGHGGTATAGNVYLPNWD